MLRSGVVRHYRLGTSDQLRGREQRQSSDRVDDAVGRQRIGDLRRDLLVRLRPNNFDSRVVAKPLGQLDVIRPTLRSPRAPRSEGNERLLRASCLSKKKVDGASFFVGWIKARTNLFGRGWIRTLRHR